MELDIGTGEGKRLVKVASTLLKRTLEIAAITNYDSTLVVRGGVKKNTKQLAAHETTTIKTRLKHLKRLKEKPKGTGKPNVTIKLAATDEFGQTATKELKIRLYRCGDRCVRPHGHQGAQGQGVAN
jgi:hypothetical protein